MVFIVLHSPGFDPIVIFTVREVDHTSGGAIP